MKTLDPGALAALVLPAVLALGTHTHLSAQVPRPTEGEGPRAAAPRVEAPEPALNLPAPEELGLLPGRPRVAPPRTETPPVIDGILDDEVWASAAHITEFTQQAPIDGAPATEATDVYIAYDSENLYFAFYAYYEDPAIMRANHVERDRAMQDDLMTLYFDTFLDQQRGYDFDVNGYGVQGDGVITAGGGGGGGGRGGGGRGGWGGGPIPRADRSWNTLFDTAGRIAEDGFTAEMAIPFKSLRYPSPPEGEPHRWGFQIVREVKGKDQENQVWAPMSRDETSFFAQMGILEGMTDISTSRNLEFMPTLTAIQYGELDPALPGFVNQSTDPDAGLNIKYGITSDLTADFTINPDFSQIEHDRPQIEVNQRFPLFYSELRPFFVEGAEIFRFQAPVTVVHTRTIVDPDYGAKLSGQAGRFSLGVLTANDQAAGRLDDPEDAGFGKTAQTFIGRARYDLYAESNLGVIVTGREFLDSHSRTLGFDGNFRLGPTLSAGFSAIGSSNQDRAGTEAGGHLVMAGLRRNGRHASFSLSGHEISREFDTAVGFVRRRDIRRADGNIGYQFRPETWIINWGPSASYSRNYDFDGVLQDENRSARMNFNFARSISVFSNFSWDMERFRGIDFEKQGFFVRGNVNTNRRYSFGADFSMGEEIFYSGLYLGEQVGYGADATVRPIDSVQSSVSFERRRFTDPANNDREEFDVRIFRATTNVQFTSRLGMRNIIEVNSQSDTFDFNLLFNYRVNAGTVIYAGYDDHFMRADLIEGDLDGDGYEEQLYYTTGKKRLKRAFFVKFQYLFRY